MMSKRNMLFWSVVLSFLLTFFVFGVVKAQMMEPPPGGPGGPGGPGAPTMGPGGAQGGEKAEEKEKKIPKVDEKFVELVLLHTNNVYGHLLPVKENKSELGGSAYASTLIKQIRSEYDNVLLMDAGDLAQGTAVADLTCGLAVVRAMDRMGYDFAAIGNHDFDWGRAKLHEMCVRATFRVLCANVIKGSTSRGLPATRPYWVKNKGGVKVGVIGISSPQLPSKTKKSYVKDLNIKELSETVRMYADACIREGAKVIVVLSHLGYEADKALAEDLDIIDIIVGGHKETPLKHPDLVNGTLIVNAGMHGRYLGKLVLKVGQKTGTIKEWTYLDETIPVDPTKIKADPEVAAIVDEYTKAVAAQVEQVVGEATADIVRTPAEGSSDTPLGNFVCKVMKEYAEDVLKDYCTCGKTHKVDAAIFHSAGLRNDIKQGTLTWGDLFSVLPFNNYVVTMKLTGSQLRQVLEEGVAGRRTVQVSGVTFSYSPEAEAGKRVITKSILVNGKPLKLKKVYLVATIDALAAGYEGYFTFTKGKNVFFLERKDKARKLESSFLRDVLIRYIHTHTPVSPAETGNIKIEE